MVVGMEHVYLSPHLDDAALSCGGAIAAHRARGADVLVVTLASAVPPAEGSGTRRWAPGLEPERVIERLAEDTEAMSTLGVDFRRAGLLDAIYRLPDVYSDATALFAPPAKGDPITRDLAALLADLGQRFPDSTLHAPLGIGLHVDHLAVHLAARQAAGWRTVVFYEDFPYVIQSPGALERRLAQVGLSLVPRLIDVSATIERRVAAVAAYSSQIDLLFGGLEPLVEQVVGYAASLRPPHLFEREWARR